MESKHLLIFIAANILLCLVTSCRDKDCHCKDALVSEKPPVEYNDLVKKASLHYFGKYFMENDTAFMDTAIMRLDDAIRIGKKYYSAYYFKAFAYFSIGDYVGAVRTADSALTFSYSTPDMYFLKGMALDHLSKRALADEALQKASKSFDEWLNCYPDSTNLIVGEIEYVAYSKGKDAALKRAEEYVRKHPKDETIIGYRDFIKEEPAYSMTFGRH